VRYRPVVRFAIAPRRAAEQGSDMDRATQRPAGFKNPAHWTTEPVPEPRAPEPSPDPLDPTRYGDWVHKGIAVDF